MLVCMFLFFFFFPVPFLPFFHLVVKVVMILELLQPGKIWSLVGRLVLVGRLGRLFSSMLKVDQLFKILVYVNTFLWSVCGLHKR